MPQVQPELPREQPPPAASQPPRPQAACSQSQAEPLKPGPLAGAAEQSFSEQVSQAPLPLRVPRQLLALHAPSRALPP